MCAISNTGVVYPFAGATLEAQSTNVVAFANAMSMNNGPYAAFFLDDTGGLTTEQVSEQIFGTTDKLYYSDSLVYGAIGEDTLLSDLEEAGDLFLAFLGA